MKFSVLRTFSFVASLCVTLTMFSGCKNKIEVTALESITPLTSNDSVKAAELIKANIVKIENTMDNSKIVGTGFFDTSGYLITNSHIVDIKGGLQITYPDGSTATAQLAGNDIHSDVAILAVEEPKCKAMFFG